jgi:DNA-binding CsgD family transcriptional regulator
VAISEGTVAAMLATVREAALTDDLPRAIVRGFEQVLGVDYATYDEFGPAGARVYADPAPAVEIAASFNRYGNQHPSLVDYRLTRDPRTRRLSDVVSQRRLRRLGLWGHVFRPLGIRHQLNLALHSSGRHLIGVGLSRTGRDFTDEELSVAELLRVELGRIVAARHGPPPETFEAYGLTAREAEVLSLAASRTSAQVAGLLSISERTVEKHLEHAYGRLGVSSRDEALALVRGD